MEPIAGDHFVQLYKQDERLVEAVSLFAGQGLGRSHGVVLVMTPAHCEAVKHRLKEEDFAVEGLVNLGQLLFVDAESLLAKFMQRGMPDPQLFKGALGSALGSVRSRGRHPRLRVFGEMVDLLWRAGNLAAAIRLEELWNEAVAANGLSLFCAYALDGHRRDQFPDALCAAHSHVLPAPEASGF